MIHVARDGAKLGEFTLEQVREGLSTGQFRATDLGWQTGMAEWRPLSEIAGATAGAPPVAAPLAVPDAPAAGTGLPWENRQQIGLVKAWLDTVSLLIAKPSEAFAMMRPEGGMMDPLLFGLIGGCAGSIVSILFQALLRFIPGFGGRDDLFNMFGISQWVFLVIYAVLSPLFVLLGLFLAGALLHVCLMLVGGANRPFETTFRVVCFTAGAANLFSMIPMCGGLIAAVYNVVLECIGLSRAHQTTTGKALMAIFLPLIVCCGVAIILGIVLGGFGAFLNKH
ncbi:MAG: hypothetical protein QOJ87_1203 [Verrucomicrobiota bacterium]|jgi:hypothetical protein